MKTILTLITLALATASFSFANAATTGAAGKRYMPCKNIRNACESAGFVKKGHKTKKGLWLDCVKPVLEGKSVPGVTVSQKDVKECNVRRRKWRKRREERRAREKKANKS